MAILHETHEVARECRYFPSDNELKVLVCYLQVYFSHPERSLQRSRIVQCVVNALRSINSHWNNRTVRLWFNNNRKMFFKEKSIGSFLNNLPDSINPINLRSISVPNSYDGKYYENKQKIEEIQNHMDSNNLGFEKYRLLELEVGEKLISTNNDRLKLFDIKNSEEIGLKHIITSSNDPIISPKTAEILFEYIETGCWFDNGSYGLITFDPCTQVHNLLLNNDIIELPFDLPASSIEVIDNNTYVYAFRYLYCYNSHHKEWIMMDSQSKTNGSSITLWNNNVTLATGSSLFCWDSNCSNNTHFTQCINTYFERIDSICSIAGNLVISSRDYHSSMVFATNGSLLTRLYGHTSGISCLSEYDQNCFLSGSADQTIILWDIRNATPGLIMSKNDGIVTSLFGSQETYRVFSGSTDGKIRGWDLRYLSVCFCSFPSYSAPMSLFYSPFSSELNSIYSERYHDIFYDLGKYKPIWVTKEYEKMNSIQKFHIP